MPLPPEASFDEADVVEPVALALHAFDLLSPKIGQWTTILGQGPIGFLMTQVAKISGCRIIAIDTEDHRLKLSEKYGADVCLNPKNEKIVKNMESITKGGSDIVVEAAGRQETVEQTVSLVRKNGKVALVGNFSGFIDFGKADEATFFNVIVNPAKYLLALEMLAKRISDVKGLITHKYRLADFNSAIETALDPRRKAMKVLITNGKI